MTVAEATYVCEVCATPLRYHGGPHRPRWCGKHREGHRRRQNRRQQERHRKDSWAVPGPGPAVYCDLCATRLLEPSGDGICGFCRVEVRDNWPDEQRQAA